MQVNPMLRAFLRLFSSSPQRPSSIHNRRASSRDPVVLYAHSDHPSERVEAGRLPKAASERVNHRARLMSMRLEHTRLCSQQRCKRLREYGILTAGDMATADPKQIAQKFAAPKKAVRILKQYRRAIRLAAAVPGMMPRDAQLLISIHRRSVRGLALESPASLHRDLQRFAESSPGRRQLRGRRLPSTRRIKRWISACESYARNRPMLAPAA
jgi:hypothetical protein